MHSGEIKMSLSVSFYRPLDYFGGAFNRFVSWFTSGDFCHCELVVHTTPHDIMDSVKTIYQAAQQGEYAPEDCHRIITEIEMNFFTTEFRKAAQTRDNIVLSFSLLWGHPMCVRVLTETAHDSWFKIPQEGDRPFLCATKLLIAIRPEQICLVHVLLFFVCVWSGHERYNIRKRVNGTKSLHVIAWSHILFAFCL